GRPAVRGPRRADVGAGAGLPSGADARLGDPLLRARPPPAPATTRAEAEPAALRVREVRLSRGVRGGLEVYPGPGAASPRARGRRGSWARSPPPACRGGGGGGARP